MEEILLPVSELTNLVRDLAAESPPHLQDAAVARVAELSAESGNWDAIVAAHVIPSLVQLLSSGRQDTVDAAVTALGNLGGNPQFSPTIVAAGAVPPMVQLLQSDSHELPVR
ncbi:hypothetical protein FOA52_003213 [Chlamydomonas sp. UWO 241]|nr:hypothetical protein FOA52_003213 [Chlamydomonas sp. UWO 241]